MSYSFGEKLKSLRTKRGLSQEELADELNKEFGTSINKGMISKWENDRESPRMKVARNISAYFNISLDELLELKNATKEKHDIAKDLERIMIDLATNNELVFHGEPLEDEDRELLKRSLENSLIIAAQIINKNRK